MSKSPDGARKDHLGHWILDPSVDDVTQTVWRSSAGTAPAEVWTGNPAGAAVTLQKLPMTPIPVKLGPSC